MSKVCVLVSQEVYDEIQKDLEDIRRLSQYYEVDEIHPEFNKALHSQLRDFLEWYEVI
jgi:hypothetical protein